MSNNTKNVFGNSIDFTISNDIINNFSEIKADIPVTTYESIRVWGQVVDHNGTPVPYALLKLIKCIDCSYTGVAHTTADCQGYYQFDLCPERCAHYKILASKSPTGQEYALNDPGNCPTNCDVPDPCQTY